jgi:hypothetical protein
MSPGIFSHYKHLSQMRLRLSMTLEPILVSALFLAHLAVPAESLETLGFHLVGDIFWGSDCIQRLVSGAVLRISGNTYLQHEAW